MNPTLSAVESAALLEILHRGLVYIRLSAEDGHVERAKAIADALYEVPFFLSHGHEWGFTLESFRDGVLAPLIERYPDLAGLQQPLERVIPRSRPRPHDRA